MALWDRISSRGNVEDRRSMTPIAVGGFSLTGLALYLAFNFLTGGDLSDVLSQLPTETQEYQGQDSYEVFASTVLGSNNDMWVVVFQDMNRTYSPPRLVLFRTATQSDCGVATSEVGPHYCSLDNTIYLDETFFEELANRFGGSSGDVAQAYVIAHEVAHHAQSELGILDRVQSGNNTASQQLELQADCFAGMWANSIRDEGVLEPGEIKEAMDAAAAVGDDRIQSKVTGQINPETWTHGSSAERVSWFMRGYNSGSIEACNTL